MHGPPESKRVAMIDPKTIGATRRGS